MKTASPESVDYVLYVPEKWIVDSVQGSLVTSAHVGEGDNSNITMLCYTTDLSFESIESYWADYEKGLVKIFDLDENGATTYRPVESTAEAPSTAPSTAADSDATAAGETDLLDDEKCRAYRYTGVVGGVPLEYLQVICFHEGYLYVFTYTATTENDRFARHEEDIVRILQNFRFTK